MDIDKVNWIVEFCWRTRQSYLRCGVSHKQKKESSKNEVSAVLFLQQNRACVMLFELRKSYDFVLKLMEIWAFVVARVILIAKSRLGLVSLWRWEHSLQWVGVLTATRRLRLWTINWVLNFMLCLVETESTRCNEYGRLRLESPNCWCSPLQRGCFSAATSLYFTAVRGYCLETFRCVV